MSKTLILLSVLLFSGGLYSQTTSLDDYNRHMQSINQGGWIAYGAGAFVGLGVGTIGLATSTDLQTKHFHQMHIMASLSHLSFAIPGYISSVKRKKMTFDEKSTYQSNIKYEHAWLFNAGLDVFYTTTGLRLRQLGKVNPNYPELLTGWGNALIIHGAFLFCADLTMTILHITHRRRKFDPNIEFSSGPDGIGFKWKL